MAVIGQDIDQAARIILNGGLVGMPTETVYGLAANALDEKAVLDIFKVKRRPSFDPLIVHVASLEMLHSLATGLNDSAQELLYRFWPGPLTLILKKKNIVPDLVTSGHSTVAVRMPKHPMALKLIEKSGVPIAAPSANPFGYVSPTRPSHVDKQLGDQIPYILDGGKCAIGIESTILEVSDEEIKVLRLGGLSPDLLLPFKGKITFASFSSSNPVAPGMLTSHYSPKKKFVVGNLIQLMEQYPEAAILSYTTFYPGRECYVLSKKADLTEAASNLFHFMRSLDEGNNEVIIAELVPPEGLGRAINDRLVRASAS